MNVWLSVEQNSSAYDHDDYLLLGVIMKNNF